MTTTVLAAIEMRRRTRLRGLEVFLASLRTTNPAVRVVILNRSPEHWELSQLLERFGVESVDTRVMDLRYKIPPVEVEIARFLQYYHWLSEHPVESAVLCDCLDVLWQGPIPETNWSGITVYQENVVVAECPYNSKWAREVWPDAEPRLMDLFQPAICCGVIMGRVHGMGLMTYLSQYQAELMKRPKVKRGFDSAVLLGIANDHPEYIQVMPYANNDCMHLGYAHPSTVTFTDGLVAVANDPDAYVQGVSPYYPAIVHQYNRHVATGEIYKRWSI